MQEYRIGKLGGRLVVTWHQDGRRRRFRLEAATIGEAHAEARALLTAERALRPGTVTVAELWEAYREDRAGRPVAESMRHTGRSVLPHFGHLDPASITVQDCRAYIAARRAAGRQDGTIWTQLGHLRNTLSWAVKRGLIDRAPHIERPAQPAPRERWLTRAEIDRLLAATAEPHVKLAILIMLTTGARIGATLELTWERVDLERGWLDLRAGGATRKGRAVVPINATLRAALTTARAAALSDHVVEWAAGPVRSIKRGFASAVRVAGLRDVTPHVLRHTAAVHMAAGGVPMSKIAQYLGHTSTEVTERTYARYAPDHMRDAAEILDFATLRAVQRTKGQLP